MTGQLEGGRDRADRGRIGAQRRDDDPRLGRNVRAHPIEEPGDVRRERPAHRTLEDHHLRVDDRDERDDCHLHVVKDLVDHRGGDLVARRGGREDPLCGERHVFGHATS